MFTRFTLLILVGLFAILPSHLFADIVVPGADGSDGALVADATIVIDLSEAVTGNWDDDNSANPGKGIYDPEKWVVVFKYSDVTVDAGVTVSFKNHPSRAPVVWLVSGNCAINGTVNLNGQFAQLAPLVTEPGPGGFRGGAGTYSEDVRASAGFGPGGGSIIQSNAGYGGSYGTAGEQGGSTYGNPSLIPLIGGSGGGADRDLRGSNDRRGGGGGAGAILIAVTGNCSIDGSITANGGSGWNASGTETGGGSGGGIRIVAGTLNGTGTINAIGGGGWSHGGSGRIRIERAENANTLQVVPSPSVVDLAENDTALLWPPSNSPKVSVVSIGGVATPSDPNASFGAFGADVAVAETNSTEVVIETENVEEASQVLVRISPRTGSDYTEIQATRDVLVTEDPLRWTADLPTNVGYSAVQVRVVRP